MELPIGRENRFRYKNYTTVYHQFNFRKDRAPKRLFLRRKSIGRENGFRWISEKNQDSP